MLVGAFRQEITPYDLSRTRLAGFGFDRRAWGVLDPLYARVLYLADGREEFALAALDLIGVTYDTTRRIRRRVRGLAPERVHVCCTHTHSGPDTIGFWGPSVAGVFPVASGVDPRYMEWLEDEVAYAVEKARNDARPATARVAVDRSPKAEWSRNVRQPDLVDEDLTALRFVGADGETIATVVHFGTHPEGLWDRNHLVSADVVAPIVDAVEATFGGVGIFWNGALGGMVTVGYDEKMRTADRPAWVRKAGQALGGLAVAALRDGARRAPASDLAFARAEVRAPLESRTLHLARNLGLFDREADGDHLVTEVAALRMGPIRIALLPGELLPAVGLRARKILGGEVPIIVSVANDEIGYVLPAEGFDDPRYKYECSMSLGRQTADLLCNALAEIATRL